MKKSVILPEAAVRRRASGKCELCGAEFNLGLHHIIARQDGGLNHEDNLILLCRRCHDRIEDRKYISRADLFRGESSKPEPSADVRKSRAEKAAATRAANVAAQLDEVAELETWDIWSGMTAGSVPVLTPEQAAQVKRPEKSWHVIVYGAGRHAGISQES